MSFINAKIFVLTAFMLILAALFSDNAQALNVSIDRVKVNGNAVAESRTNLINDTDIFFLTTDLTAVESLEKGHVEAIIRGRQSGNSVSDSTGIFDLAVNQSTTVNLTFALLDSLNRETEYDLTIKVTDFKSKSQQKEYGIKTKQVILDRPIDVSIDRVIVNAQAVATSKTNFINESDSFDVLVEFTNLEDLEDTHVEAILKDLRSSNVVADASSNFDLSADLSSSVLLRLELLDRLKKSGSFELTIKIIDAEGKSIQQLYGIVMEDEGIIKRDLDLSIENVEIENKILTENENNFVMIRSKQKELDLRVSLISIENVKNARIDAVLSFENGDVVADTTQTFDLTEEERIVKTLELPLIDKFEQGNFELKLMVTDSEGDSQEKLYELKISQKKFPLFPVIINSFSLSPMVEVQAGKYLITRLNLKNIGVVPIQDVNAKVTIQELGISATDFIDEIDSGESKLTKEMFLKIPDGTEMGAYTVKSEVILLNRDDTDSKSVKINVIGREQVQHKAEEDVQYMVDIAETLQIINQKQTSVVYPVLITNKGNSARAFTLLVDGIGIGDFGTYHISPTNTLVIEPGQSRTLDVVITLSSEAFGEKIFKIIVKSGSEALREIPFKVMIEKNGQYKQYVTDIRKIIEWFVVITVLLFTAIAILYAVMMYSKNKGEKGERQEEKITSTESYY